MKRAYFISLFLCLTTSLLSQSSPVSRIDQTASVPSSISASQPDPQAQAKILDGYGKLPLSFEANEGQADAPVKFLSRTGGYTLFLSGDEAVFAWSGKKAKKSGGTANSAAAKPTEGEPALGEPRFVSGYRFSDTANPGKQDAPSGAGRRPSTLSADSEVVATVGVLRMKLRNANPAARVTGEDELAGTSNYFIGNDPAKWRTNVPTYAKVKYEGIYPGIDLVYYGNQRQLEYDFVVAPGADPHRIAFDVRGAKRMRQDEHGDLVLTMKMGEDEIRWHKPVVYQEKNGERQEIAARYAITGKNRVGFELAKYDASRPLYIDPLIYSTFLGGSGYDNGYGIAVDSDGNAYVVGTTCSTDFPTTAGALQTVYGGSPDCSSGGDAFVTKINPLGSALVYSTYLGGSGFELGYGGIAVDSAGNAYVTGLTESTDFPVTPGALQTTYGGTGDAFVTKISPTGSALVYSTYLGGTGWEVGWGIAVGSAGSAYVTGYTESANFPITLGAFQTTLRGFTDAFVSKINPSGSALVYSTYLGGSENEGTGDGSGNYKIAVDSAGNAYVAGYTESSDFPTTPGAFQTTCAGGCVYGDATVTKINSSGSVLVYSTYLGGSGGDIASAIAVDRSGNAYVTGGTGSFDFPTTPGAYQTTRGSSFVTKINSLGSDLVYSTYLGSNGTSTSDIAVDGGGNAYVTGWTYGDIPADNAFGGNSDAFVSKFNPRGSAIVYSSYLGGTNIDGGNAIAVDSPGNAYVTGGTRSVTFPTTPGAFQTKAAGGLNTFVIKRDGRQNTTTTISSSLNPSTYGQTVTLRATVTSFPGTPTDGETVTFKQGTAVLGTGTLSGGSATFTTSTLTAGTKYIKAVYGGDANFGPSMSTALKQMVKRATTTTTLASSRNPSNFGQSVTFSASVTSQFGVTVKGSVTYYDGTTVLKTDVGLSAGVARYTTSTLTSGSHTITATYNGNANFVGSSASLTQTVN